jgi:hypothetical protein
MKEDNTSEQTSQKSERKKIIPKPEISVMIILGTVGAVAWIIMFGLGLLVNSQVYRDSVLKGFSFTDFIMSILTYTPTNIALLCIIAAFSGGCASRLLLAGVVKHEEKVVPDPGEVKTDSQVYMSENPFSSMLRGLVVYFTFLGGVFIATPNPFANTTPSQFAQSAGVVSLLSFVVGYDPTVFRSLINLAGKFKKQE